MKLNFIYLLILLIPISSFNEKSNKKERKGILIYHLLAANTLFFTEDTSFLKLKNIKNKINLTKIIVLKENEYPFYSDSIKNNFSHFKIFRTHNLSMTDSAEVFYSNVKIVFPYLVKNKRKDSEHQILVNGKKVTFRIFNASEPSILIYE